MITYRLLTEQADFIRVAQLEQTVWGTTDIDAISWTIMTVITHTGGAVHGAFDGDKLVGGSLATPMKNEPRLWSHIAAVHPDYQRQGIGYTIKQVQREWAMTNDYECMSWTFDPLQSANAHFNFHLLGVTSNTYHVNFYGEMQDNLNRGVPSDRFEVIWPFAKQDAKTSTPPDSAPFLLTCEDNQPVVVDEAVDDWYFVEIPRDYARIREEDKALAIKWKIAVRNIMQLTFAQGYQVADFMRRDERNWYVLRKV